MPLALKVQTLTCFGELLPGLVSLSNSNYQSGHVLVSLSPSFLQVLPLGLEGRLDLAKTGIPAVRETRVSAIRSNREMHFCWKGWRLSHGGREDYFFSSGITSFFTSS